MAPIPIYFVMRVQQFSNYRSLIRGCLEKRKALSSGKIEDLAKALGVSASQVSQVFSGSREMTPEQACRAASFFNLNALESEYLIGLVQYERTSSAELKTVVRKQLDRVREDLERIEEKQSLSSEGVSLSDEERGVFYSQWYYSAIRLLSEVPGMNTAEKVSRRLGLPIRKVEQAVKFLIETGLCVRTPDGFSIGPSRTYTKRGSPFHGRHHLNWRVKALEYLPKEQPQGLSYTGVVSISVDDALRIRDILFKATEEAEALLGSSTPHSLFCLSLDWFEL